MKRIEISAGPQADPSEVQLPGQADITVWAEADLIGIGPTEKRTVQAKYSLAPDNPASFLENGSRTKEVTDPHAADLGTENGRISRHLVLTQEDGPQLEGFNVTVTLSVPGDGDFPPESRVERVRVRAPAA